jgi:Flp pilus assembly protein TadD
MAQGAFGEAVDTYDQALGSTDLTPLVISRFRAQILAGNGEEALTTLKNSLANRPEEPAFIRAIAERLHQLGRLDEARGYYERLIELNPNDAKAYNNLANLLAETDSEKAFAAAKKAHDLASTDPSILDTYGWALIQVGDLDKGLALLRDAVARDGQYAISRYHLGIALEEYGSTREARRQLQKAVEIMPNARWAGAARNRIMRLQ